MGDTPGRETSVLPGGQRVVPNESSLHPPPEPGGVRCHLGLVHLGPWPSPTLSPIRSRCGGTLPQSEWVLGGVRSGRDRPSHPSTTTAEGRPSGDYPPSSSSCNGPTRGPPRSVTRVCGRAGEGRTRGSHPVVRPRHPRPHTASHDPSSAASRPTAPPGRPGEGRDPPSPR